MYSQCPQCQAIFSVSEAHLAAYHGLVRCGRCTAVFHAVTNEVPNAPAPPGEVASRASDTPVSRYAAAVERRAAEAPPDASEPGREVPPSVSQPEPEVDAGGHGDGQGDGHGDDQGDDQGNDQGSFQPDNQRGDQALPREPDPAQANEAVEESGEVEETGDVEEARDVEEAGERGEDPEQASASHPSVPDNLPGEITEEILIEAPPTVHDVFDEPGTGEAEATTTAGSTSTTEAPAAAPAGAVQAHETASQASGKREPASAAGAPARASASPGASQAANPQTALQSPYRARDIRMVELPQPRPFKTASLSLFVVLLILLMFWQVKAFYLDELSQVPVLRPYLERICRPLGCVLPPRRDFARIDMLGTSIDVNPEVPGALQITATLINRAHFPQPYPLLRVTLSDSDGRIVGRRTYTPSEYQDDSSPELLPIRDQREAVINLAQPARNAVGYEVELVPPVEP